MTPRRLTTLLLAATLFGAGAYLLVYLYRWEWNRALTAGIFVVIAEVALVAVGLNSRLRRIEDRLTAPAGHQVLTRIRETRPEARHHFAWLQRPDRTGVFVPVLMGAGMIMSGLAWVIERLARHTARPTLERGLAARLAPLTLERGSLVPPRSDSIDHVPPVLLRPGSRT
jgi:hypothetical protein